jgi:ABC-type phosphate transport system ATPase subunit
MNRKQFVILVISSVVLVGAGCGKSASQYATERTAEKLIEKQTGGKVNIDTSNNTVKYQTKEGTFQSGDNVQIPANFPKDIYIAEGKVVSAISNNENDIHSISIQSSEKASDLAKKYEEKFKADGWKITGSMNFGDTFSVIAEKDSRQVSVMIGKTDKETTVVISVGKK